MIKILNKPIPAKDESPISVLLRASSANGWPTFISMFYAHKVKMRYSKNKVSDYVCHVDIWNKICNHLKINKSSTNTYLYNTPNRSDKKQINFNYVAISQNQLRTENPHICPQCINDEPYAKSLWDYRLITSCTKHNIKLVHQCQQCQKPISWLRPSLSTCDCGFDLLTSDTIKTTVQDTKFIENLLINKDKYSIAQINLYYELTHDVIEISGIKMSSTEVISFLINCYKCNKMAENQLYNIAIYALHHKNIHPRVSLSPFIISKCEKQKILLTKVFERLAAEDLPYIKTTTSELSYIKCKAASLVLGTSTHVTLQLVKNDLLKAQKSSNTSPWMISVKAINKLLIRLSRITSINTDYKKSKSTLIPPGKTSLSNSVNDVLKKEKSAKFHIASGLLSLHLCEKKNRYITKDSSHLLSIKEVSEICNVHYENIRFLIHNGRIKRVPAEKTKGTAIFIHRSIATAFNEQFVFAGLLARENKTNTTNFSEKLTAAGVKAVSGPNIDGGLTYLFKRKDIDKIDLNAVKRIKNYPTKTGRKHAGYKSSINKNNISLLKTSRVLNTSIQSISKLIKKGTLKTIPTNSRKITVCKKSLHSLLETINNKKLIETKTAAQQCNEELQTFLFRWVESDFCHLTDITIHQYIKKSDLSRILKFKHKYITGTDASREHGTHRSTVSNLVKSSLITPAKTFVSRGKKIHYYEKKKLLSVLESIL